MRAKNYREVLHHYLIFLGYFTSLLIITIVCWLLFLQTESSFINTLKSKKAELEFYKNKKISISDRIDSINHYMTILNTNLIKDEVALERKILLIKNESLQEIELLEKNNINDFFLYKAILLDVENVLESKKDFRQSKEEEYILKNKLQECSNANKKLKNRN